MTNTERPPKAHISERIYLDIEVHPPELVMLTYRGIQRKDYERITKSLRDERDNFLMLLILLSLVCGILVIYCADLYGKNQELNLQVKHYQEVAR